MTMTPKTTPVDLIEIEARARQMRGEALAQHARALVQAVRGALAGRSGRHDPVT